MLNPNSEDPSQNASSGGKKKYVVLLGLFLLVCVGWSVFWYVSYTKTQALVDRVLARQVNGQPVIACTDQTLGGYPFRLLLTCSSFTARDPKSGWVVSGSALRAIWQVYAPNLAIVEADNHLQAQHQSSGELVDVAADVIRGSVRLSPTDFVARLSLEAKAPKITSNNPRIASLLGAVEAKALELHLRPNPDNTEDLDIVVSGSEVAVGRWPIVSGNIGGTAIAGLSPAIRNGGNPAKLWLAQSGKLNGLNARLEIGQKTLGLKGDVAFNRQGQASGDLKLRVLNPRPEDAIAKETLTARQDGLNGPLTALQLMGKPIAEGKLIGSEIDISLQEGQIRAGFLPLGRLPAFGAQ